MTKQRDMVKVQMAELKNIYIKYIIKNTLEKWQTMKPQALVPL